MKKRKTKSLSWWHVPFCSSIASLGVLKGDFLPSSTFSQSLAVGLPHFSGHGSSLPRSAENSPYKALQGSAWPPAPAQPRLVKKVSNQQGTTSYHYAHESQLFSFSMSWAAIALLSLFLKEPGPWMGGVESDGSWGEWRWGSRERKAFWEAAQTPASLCLPWYAVWRWHLWNLLAPTYLWNQPAPGCLHDNRRFGPPAIVFGRPIQIHQVAPISTEVLTVCYWHSKFQVTFGNFSWHSERSRRTKTFLHLKMQNIWPWL